MKYEYNVGSTYETQAGDMVRVIGRVTTYKGYECLQCSDDKHRYDRSTHSEDAGRCTGTDNDNPHNFKR